MPVATLDRCTDTGQRNIRAKRNQFNCVFVETGVDRRYSNACRAARPIDQLVAPARTQRVWPVTPVRHRRRMHKHADATHALVLLRERHEWPSSHAAECRMNARRFVGPLRRIELRLDYSDHGRCVPEVVVPQILFTTARVNQDSIHLDAGRFYNLFPLLRFLSHERREVLR